MKNLLSLMFIALFACNAGSDKQENKLATEHPPFWNDIQSFKKQDSTAFPPQNAILFIGSSSFTMWQDVQKDFPGYTIVNRGFGGSTLLDQIRYEKDIIVPYKPKQIVIYCGENDLASSDSVTAIMAFERFKELFQSIRKELPDLPIAYVSMKPSPSRRHLFSKMREGNQLIKDFLANQKNTAFIDVHQPMLNEAGEPIPEIFLEDSLHMNAKGYAIWQETMKPYLIK